MFVGILWENLWLLSPTTKPSKFGERPIGNSRQKSGNPLRTLLVALSSAVSGKCHQSCPSFSHRVCSWSPDGAHITASNATNNKGFVFIAAVITRGTWTSEISLVGHENTVEVAVRS